MTGKSENPTNTKNAFEWSVFGVSLLLVCGLLGFLVVGIYQGAGTPASLLAISGEPFVQEGSLNIPITLKNNGGLTAKSVTVKLQVSSKGKVLEPSLAIESIAPQATAEGIIVLHGVSEPASILSTTTTFENP